MWKLLAPRTKVEADAVVVAPGLSLWPLNPKPSGHGVPAGFRDLGFRELFLVYLLF